jgi:hypothetical protein
MADFGSALSGAVSGASAGSAAGPWGTAIGGVGGLLAGLLGGGGPRPGELAAKAGGSNSQILGEAFRSPQSAEQQQQVIAQRVLAAYPKLGTLENALKWYAVRKKLANEGGKISKKDLEVIAVVDSALSEQGINIDMSNPDQLKSIFGEQGAAFLSTPVQDLITMNQQAVQTAREIAAQAPQILQEFKAEAGIELTPEQQLAKEQRRNLLVSSILEPARSELASAGATAERSAAARGLTSSPLLERDILRERGKIGAEAGRTAALSMEDARQKALAQLPDVISKSIAAGLTPEQYVNQVEGARVQAGMGQAQLAQAGFQGASQLALGERELAMKPELARIGQESQYAKLAQQKKGAEAEALAGLGASVETALSGGKKDTKGMATDAEANKFFDSAAEEYDIDQASKNITAGVIRQPRNTKVR